MKGDSDSTPVGQRNDPYSKVRFKRREGAKRFDGPLVTKMIVGAVSFTAFVMMVYLRVLAKTEGDDARIDPIMAITIALCSSCVGAGIGAMLGWKDRVQKRLAHGDHVGFLTRSLFGNGVTSLVIWICLILFGVLIVLPILLTIRAF